MLRTFLLPLCLILCGAWCVATFGCGSSSSAKCTGGPYDVVGNWQSTFTAGDSSLAGYGVINSAGLALFFDNSAIGFQTGDTLELPSITGSTCAFSGDLTIYAEPGSVQAGSATFITDTANGSITSTTAISGSFTGTTAGKFSAAPFSPLSGAPTALTGAMTAESQGTINGNAILLSLSFSSAGSGASMSFTGSDGNTCNITGTFTQEGTANVFDVSATFTGASCAITGTQTGLGFESTTDYFTMNGDATVTYLYADLLATGSPFVLEIFPPSVR
jgi:hypothetical protein